VTLAGSESGSATVVVLACVLVCVVTGGIWLASGRAALARQRAETAADLAALAGAQSVAGGAAAPCAAAGVAAAANGGRLLACAVAGEKVTVTVAVSRPTAARAMARAGQEEGQ
jgi:secretion/DNA translocation related TadE-like protein